MNMKDWVPIPGSSKARLLELALRDFGARGYEGVNVVELAAEAGLTTGSLYHHFENKLGLYGVVRDELEQRVLDRMEGAAAAVMEASERDRQPPGTADNRRQAALRAALLVGYDAAIKQGAARLLSEPDPRNCPDRIVALLASIGPVELPELALLLAATWRAALAAGAADLTAGPGLRRALERLASG
jgi:AcrR family transcriptional regulator